MVLCCVPRCGTNSATSDPSITFHEFPSSPDLAAKWIKQINCAINVSPMWVPRGKVLICSKHFLQTDFKDNSDILKPRCVPSVFGHRFIGVNAEINRVQNQTVISQPLIVKVKTGNNVIENIQVSEVHSSVLQSLFPDAIIKSENNSVAKNMFNNTQKQNATPKTPQVKQVCTPRTASANFIPRTKTINTSSSTLLNTSNSSLNADVSKGSMKLSVKRKPESTLKDSNWNKKKANQDLIEIGPNTFLKINPDLIKVNKKVTPSGNTVLQFLMDQKYSKSQINELLPKVIQGPFTIPGTSAATDTEKNLSNNVKQKKTANSGINDNSTSNKIADGKATGSTVQHVLGHLVNTHVCEETHTNVDLTKESEEMDENSDDMLIYESVDQNSSSQKDKDSSLMQGRSTEILDKAPVLLTTNLPLNHCFTDKPKFIMELKKKNREIANLKLKIQALNKKIEDLEDKCIVQDRQLSYAFIKRLKNVRKSAAKGDPNATYILELVRGFSNNFQVRWSESTLARCAVWVKKAPYAYEYFKKANLFKLPSLQTVRRFVKAHPDLVTQQQKSSKNDNGDSTGSSDFDFDDDSDNENQDKDMTSSNNGVQDEDGATFIENSIACETLLTELPAPEDEVLENEKRITNTQDISPESNAQQIIQTGTKNAVNKEAKSPEKNAENNAITLDSSNLELQEIILPSGDVLQCYSSNINNGKEVEQYFFIPNSSSPNFAEENEYSVVQADALGAFLQNYVHPGLQTGDKELVSVENSEKISETVVISQS